MNEIDTITALGRLLRDGRLRDAFAADPAAVSERLAVRSADRAALAGLAISGLEAQARTLLRKRFDALSHFIPATLARLRADGWRQFQEYARNYWPIGATWEMQDACAFCEYCRVACPAAFSRAEHNRLRFVLGDRTWAMHFTADLPQCIGLRPGLQILIRRRFGRTREVHLTFGA